MRAEAASLGSRFKFNGFHFTVSLAFTFNSQVSATDTTPFTFTATPPGTTDYAVLGTESNGVFA